MPPLRPALLAALLLAPAAARAQSAEFYADLGATWAGTLVTDDALELIEVKQAIAPTVRAGAAVPFAQRYRIGAEVAFATGGVSSRFAGERAELPNVSTLALTATMGGPVWERLRWRAALGTLKYLPSEDAGIFLRGGPFTLLLGLGLEYRVPLSRSLDLRLHGRGDLHGFTTEELKSRGFTGQQWVPRVALGAGLAWGGA